MKRGMKLVTQGNPGASEHTGAQKPITASLPTPINVSRFPSITLSASFEFIYTS